MRLALATQSPEGFFWGAETVGGPHAGDHALSQITPCLLVMWDQLLLTGVMLAGREGVP